MGTQKIDPAVLRSAIDATFAHRGTDKKQFTILEKYAIWKDKESMWRAFMQDSLPNEQLISFREALEKIRKYLSRYFV